MGALHPSEPRLAEVIREPGVVAVRPSARHVREGVRCVVALVTPTSSTTDSS
jgi:hypothetical protein